MDTYPIPARSLERYFKVDGKYLGRVYKNILSKYRDWDQKDHAGEWMLLPDNIGEHLSIDETLLHRDLTTFLSNKDGHGKKGTIVASVRGTKASDVTKRLMELPEDKRMAVKEVTMDLSDSMHAIVEAAFPKALITIDVFHVMRRALDAVEELRLKSKRKAATELRKQAAEHKKRLKRLVAQRKYYRKRHPKKYSGKKRGRKPTRLNKRFVPPTLSNGDTVMELLTRSRYLLAKSGDEWTEKQRKRARLLFDMFPKIKEAYSLVCSLRQIYADKTLTRDEAKEKLHKWYDKVAACTLREMKSARDAIKVKEKEVLNYFIYRSTNAAAESLNSKMKGFRSELRGVEDLPFFMFRCAMIFG